MTVTADGAQYSDTWFAGSFDSQRNEACAPPLASDGVTRCLPTASMISSGYYGDAACTIPIVLASGARTRSTESISKHQSLRSPPMVWCRRI
jgi:hypothetical protein